MEAGRSREDATALADLVDGAHLVGADGQPDANAVGTAVATATRGTRQSAGAAEAERRFGERAEAEPPPARLAGRKGEAGWLEAQRRFGERAER